MIRPSTAPGRRARVALASLLAAVSLSGPALARPIARDDVVRLVAAAPAVRALEARAQGAADAAHESATLAPDNPEISAGVGPRVDAPDTTLAVVAAISIPVDVFGQRGARAEAAQAEAAAAAASVRSGLSAPLREALTLHALALAAKARREIVAARLRLSEELERTVVRRRQAGEVADNDVALAALQVRRDRAALALLEGEVASHEERLAAELGLPDGERADAFGPLVPGGAPRPAQAPPPSVAAAEAEVAAAHARTTSAEAARRPTISLVGQYQLDAGAHIVTAGLSLPLPLYGVGDAAVARARGDEAATSLALEAARRRARGELRGAEARVLATRRALEATTPGRAEAAAIVARAQEAYGAGETDLPALLLVRREATDTELAVVDAELGHALAVIDAMLVSGGWSR